MARRKGIAPPGKERGDRNHIGCGEPSTATVPQDPPISIARRIEQASEEDRLWFEWHPGRRYRLRPIVRGEFWPQPDPNVSHVLVEQIAPGVRIRTPLATNPPFHPARLITFHADGSVSDVTDLPNEVG